jgi:hypothetical protein
VGEVQAQGNGYEGILVYQACFPDHQISVPDVPGTRLSLPSQILILKGQMTCVRTDMLLQMMSETHGREGAREGSKSCLLPSAWFLPHLEQKDLPASHRTLRLPR